MYIPLVICVTRILDIMLQNSVLRQNNPCTSLFFIRNPRQKVLANNQHMLSQVYTLGLDKLLIEIIYKLIFQWSYHPEAEQPCTKGLFKVQCKRGWELRGV